MDAGEKGQEGKPPQLSCTLVPRKKDQHTATENKRMLYARLLLAGEDGGAAALQRQEQRAGLRTSSSHIPPHGQYADTTMFLTGLSQTGDELIRFPGHSHQKSFDSLMCMVVICFYYFIFCQSHWFGLFLGFKHQFPTAIHEQLIVFLEEVPQFSGAKIQHSLSP